MKDINTAPNPILFKNPTNFVAVGNAIYFAASDERNGQELWKADATGGGAALVKDITPGVASTTFSPFVNVGGLLFFVVDKQLWKSDGTVMVKDLIPGATASVPRVLTSVAGRLFLIARDGDLVDRLWTSDGTADGTTLVTLRLRPQELANLNGTLFVNVRANSESIDGLWKSDGTDAGTELVKNVLASDLIAVQNVLFFNVADEKHS